MQTMKVIRDKPVRYPSGPEGKEYKRGEEFTIVPGPHEARDVKAFTLIRAAEVVTAPMAATAQRPSRAIKAMSAESGEKKPVEPMMFQGTPAADPEPAHSREYSRRDMKAEG